VQHERTWFATELEMLEDENQKMETCQDIQRHANQGLRFLARAMLSYMFGYA